MEWLVEDPHRGQIALTVIALTVSITIAALGRKRPLLAIPVALGFLLLSAIAIPSFIPARVASQRSACIYYLGMIRDAKSEWAAQNKKSVGDMISEDDLYSTNDSSGILRHRHICPRGGTYTIGVVGQNPTCSLADKEHRLE